MAKRRMKSTGGRVVKKATKTTAKRGGTATFVELGMLSKPVREKFLANTAKIKADPIKALNQIVKGYNGTFV